jgi:hypothetical protein
MDPILRTGLDWFAEETRLPAHLAELHQALRELRIKLDKLPSRVFFLESPDEPYELAEILMLMGKQALSWQADAERTIERKLLAPQVEEILQTAVNCRAVLDATSKSGRSKTLRRLPLGAIRRNMESRGEPLPDRI